MSRSWKYGMLVLVCAAVVTTGARAEDPLPSTPLAMARVDSVHIAVAGRVTGLAWLGADTLAVLVVGEEPLEGGRAQAQLVLQSRSGRVWRREDVTGVLDRTLAWDGRELWSCGDVEGGNSQLYRLDPALLTVRGSYPTPGHRPAGMCSDGRFLWLADRDAGRLARFDPALNEFTRVSSTPGFSPCGLAWDGRNLWLTDVGTGRLYRLSGSRRAWSGTVEASDFLSRGRPVLLAHDGRDLWILAEGAGWLVRVRIS
jgi:streptogramin lyase